MIWIIFWDQIPSRSRYGYPDPTKVDALERSVKADQFLPTASAEFRSFRQDLQEKMKAAVDHPLLCDRVQREAKHQNWRHFFPNPIKTSIYE